MQFNRFLIAGAVALTALSTASIAAAETFNFSVSTSFTGGSVEGFTFSDNWRANSAGGGLPYMEWYDQIHSIVFDAGSFDFQSMSFGGSPWHDYYATYGGSGTAVVNMHFFDVNGDLIEADTFSLPTDNDFHAFTKDIAGVHSIAFDHSYYWPRLKSITTATAVPEPEGYAMVFAGLAVLGALARRRRQPMR